jgi:putative transposase
MRKNGFTEEQMVKILRETDKARLPEVAKLHGVSEATPDAWRKRFGTMDVPDTKRLKALEAETTRLKRPVAERDLEIEVTNEIAAKMAARGLDGSRWSSRTDVGCLAGEPACCSGSHDRRWATARAWL